MGEWEMGIGNKGVSARVMGKKGSWGVGELGKGVYRQASD